MRDAAANSSIVDQGAHELFEWLRGLSFIESSAQGLFPHDLAREALVADLHWRHPDWYAELHRRARNYYAARLQQTRGIEQQRLLFDYIFLHRDNPAVRPFLEWQTSGSETAEQAQFAMITRSAGHGAAIRGRAFGAAWPNTGCSARPKACSSSVIPNGSPPVFWRW